MEVPVTYQRRGYTNRAGYAAIDGMLVECAHLYNAVRMDWRNRFYDLGVSTSFFDHCKAFSVARKDDYWENVSVNIGRGVMRRFHNTGQAFFRRVKQGVHGGYPRFKTFDRLRTIPIADPQARMVKDGYISVKGLPKIRIHAGNLPASELLTGLSVSKRGRRVTVNLTYKIHREPLPASDRCAGIDLGVNHRAALSTGELFDRLDDPIIDAAISDKHRRLSRCKKGSGRWKERKRIVARAQERRRIRRRNANHRLSSHIVKHYGIIAMENLQIRNMTQSASGTVEQPGKGVAQKSGLNRSILSQGWGQLQQQLSYKAEWAGRKLVLVNPQYTSQTCNACGIANKASRHGERFCCTACGHVDHADINAARNILAKAMAGGNVTADVHRDVRNI